MPKNFDSNVCSNLFKNVIVLIATSKQDLVMKIMAMPDL